MDTDRSTSGTIKTARRVFDVLELARQRDGVSLPEVAEELDVATSTAHGYLTTLEGLNYLVREDDRFYLGLTFLQYGNTARDRLGYLDTIEPTLEKFAEQTGEAVWYVAEESGRAIYLMEKEGTHAARTSGEVGKEAPLHASAAGKAILAGLPDERVDEIELTEYTEATITDREALREEIAEIRDRGVAFNDNDNLMGLRAVACPIHVDGRVIGAIAVGGPAERIRGEFFHEELPNSLRGVANEVELNLTEPNF
jgi:DNA-binding IclR family transcriptional regulator